MLLRLYKILLLNIILFATIGNCNLLGQENSSNTIPSYTLPQYLDRIQHKDTLYIVNFWATWCLPCVKELPYFDAINEKYKNQPIKVLLVSFDFPESYPKVLNDWNKMKKIKSEIVWFSNQNANEFIPLIAPEWEGNLPATLLINNKAGTSKFIPNTIDVAILEEWIQQQQ